MVSDHRQVLERMALEFLWLQMRKRRNQAADTDQGHKQEEHPAKSQELKIEVSFIPAFSAHLLVSSPPHFADPVVAVSLLSAEPAQYLNHDEDQKVS